MCVYVDVCRYICLYIDIYTYVYMCIYIYVYIYIYSYIYIHIHMVQDLAPPHRIGVELVMSFFGCLNDVCFVRPWRLQAVGVLH